MNYLDLFLKFFKLGASGWGGPVGRIALLHEELIVKEKWLDEKKFGKVLAVYQALPGPEATELACYFGYSKLGRLGSIVSGLGFMLPGFILIIILAHLYLIYGLKVPEANAILYGIKPIVLALILSAMYKLGRANITDYKLLGIGFISAVIFLFTKLDFLVILTIAGIVTFLLYQNKIKEHKIKEKTGEHTKKNADKGTKKGLVVMVLPLLQIYSQLQPSQIVLMFLFFLKAGLLTFGGAYSVVPFVQYGAVYEYHWITNEQYLDGLALGSIVPAPLVIIGTFVGYLTGGMIGAIIATIGIFLPAFAFTFIGYKHIEKAVENKELQYFLAGLTASVIGLILATWVELLPIAINDVPTLALGLIAFYLIIKKFNFLAIILGSGIIGLVLKNFINV